MHVTFGMLDSLTHVFHSYIHTYLLRLYLDLKLTLTDLYYPLVGFWSWTYEVTLTYKIQVRDTFEPVGIIHFWVDRKNLHSILRTIDE